MDGALEDGIASELTAAAREVLGERAATPWLEERCRWIALGVASLSDVLSPEAALVLGLELAGWVRRLGASELAEREAGAQASYPMP